MPIWEHLLLDIEQHALGGMRYGAYWTLTNLVRGQQAAGFPVVNAHNGYIEELLATGVIGLTLLLLFYGYVALTAVDRIRNGDHFAWLTLLFVLLYLFINSTQSLMQLYLEVPFIVLLALAGLMGSRPSTKHYPSELTTITRDAVRSVRAR